MNITAKSRYALKIMIDLADCVDEGSQIRSNIATRHGIPMDFMDHILARLRAKDLVVSIRGRSGGIMLGRSQQDISLWDIISACEDHVYPVRCLESEQCSYESSCISYDAWHEVFDMIKAQLSKKMLSEMAASWRNKKPGLLPFEIFTHARECAAPRKQ